MSIKQSVIEKQLEYMRDQLQHRDRDQMLLSKAMDAIAELYVKVRELERSQKEGRT